MGNNGHRPQETLTYKTLEQTDEAWNGLREFFFDTKAFVPPKHVAVAAVATTEEGEIVGGLVCQLVPYLGPFKIREDYHGKVDYIALKKIIDSQFKGIFPSLIIQGYIAMTADERVAKLAEFAGMKRIKPIVLIETLKAGEGVPITGEPPSAQ